SGRVTATPGGGAPVTSGRSGTTAMPGSGARPAPAAPRTPTAVERAGTRVDTGLSGLPLEPAAGPKPPPLPEAGSDGPLGMRRPALMIVAGASAGVLVVALALAAGAWILRPNPPSQAAGPIGRAPRPVDTPGKPSLASRDDEPAEREVPPPPPKNTPKGAA